MTRPWQTALTGAPRSVATITPSQCTPPARVSPKRATRRPLTGQASLPRRRAKASFPSSGKRSMAVRNSRSSFSSPACWLCSRSRFCACAPEVAVVGEHAAGECGILLVQEQLEGLLAADEISGAQLPGERRAVVLYLGFTHVLLGGQRRAARGARGSLAAHLAERFAELPDRELRGAQLLREPVALDLLGAHLAGDPLDLGLDRLQLRFGLARIRLRVPRRGSRQRGAAEYHQRQGERRQGRSRRAEWQGGAIMRALFSPRQACFPHGPCP